MRTYPLSLILLFLSCVTSPFTLFALDDESTEITEVLESLHSAWDADEYRAYRINIDTPPIQQQTVVESLKATIAGDDVDVDWITKDEYDVDYFELYAAVDAKPYKSIQKIKPDKGKGEGANKKSYKQKDKDKRKENQQAKRIYYRLHQVTKKGEDQILAVTFASASSSSAANDPDAIDDLIPQLTPKSPEVAAMERFGQYPVSHYTGIADISIPIYTIKVGDLTIPIELKYHAGGHRVSDVAPRQGLGWSISGLYSLSRQVRGQVDEMSGTGMLGMQLPTFNLSCISDSDKSLLDQHINFGADMERDIFTYRTPLRSNSFVVTPDSTYFLEADRAQMSFAGGFNDFTIRDDHGNRYIYDIKENSSANHVNNTTAWHVSEILTTQPGEKLAYTYYGAEIVSYETDRVYTHTYYTDVCDPNDLLTLPNNPVKSYVQNSVTITARPIKEIFFPGGKIHFVLEESDRQDLAGGKAIDKIDIYGYDFEDNAFRKIRSFDLQYVYKTRTGGSKVLFLDKVVQRDTSDGPIGTYELSYNSTALPALHSTAIDAQGYFNNEGNSTLIPSYSIPYSTTCTGGSSTATNSTSANRNSSATYMDAWMLEQIDYPTGGSTTFEYEPHQYNNMGTPTLVGGLRIKKIVSDSGSGTIARSYRYGSSESGNGTFRDGSKLIMRTDQEINQEANTGSTNHYNYKIMRLTSGVNTLINPFEGVPVTYPEVTEYEDATATGTTGKTVYTFKDDISDGVLLGNAATSRQVLQSRHWGRGQLLSKKVYGNDGRLKVEETNTYQAIIPSNPTPTLGYIIGRWYDEIIPGTENGQGCLVDDDQYMLNQYSWYPGLLKLNSTVSRSYDDTDDSRKVERITERTYDSDYYQLTETKHINTDGDTRIQRFRYVTDLDNLTSSSSGPAIAYRRMHTNNQINTPIEIHSLRKSGTSTYYLSGLLTTYFTKTVGPETLVVPNDIFQTRIDPLSPPTSFNLVNITTGGAVTQDASYVHRLDMLSYSLRGKPATWKRPGNSTSAYEWSWALTNDVYHHRLDESILHDGSSAEHTTTYNSNIPLTGTDVLITPNGIETSYEYDTYGRFKRSKDDEGDILIEHDYVISSTGSNKVTQYVPRKGMSTLGTMVNDVMTDISFYDGLGRFEQRLLKEGAPNAIHQLVEGAVTYDNFGRIDRTYVTFHSTSSSTASKIGLPGTVHLDSKPYGRVKTYDLSPLHRPKQTLGPGNTWDTQNKYITNTYEVAPGNTIRKYVNGISGASVSGKYGANTLHMRKTISEQGNVVIEYLDNDGKIIQKSAQDSTGTYRHTAYIYDNYDRLRFVIQPESFETEQGFTIDETYFKNGVFEYRYDNLGRLISTYEPGGGRSFTVYDRLDRPVLTQSAHQHANDKWSYIRYDAYGRVAHTGELTSSSGQSTLADQFKNITQCYETFSSGIWTMVSFPSGLNSATTTIKEENVYDSNTPWNSLAPFDANHAYHTNISDVTGLRTGQFSYDSDNPNTSYFTVWYYDYRGRVIQTIRSHHLSASMSSPKKIITSFEYNHVGDVLRTKTTFQIEGESDIVHIDSTTYDHRSRPLYYASGVNTAAEVICQIDYDVTGRMARKIYQPNGSYTKGGTNDYVFRPPSPTEQNTEDVARVAIILDPGTEIDVNTISSYSAEIDPTMAQGTTINGLQTVQFHYNIRDWMTGINLNGSGQPIPNTTEGDLFSIKMEYESAERYDGTMGKLSWAHHDEALEQRSYVYSYDAANRIKMADYTGEDSEDYTVENLLYDKNGNIKQLQRMGKSGSGYAQIDNLSYVYAGNHLMRVSDSQTGNHEVDFVDRNTSGDDYEYHPDGCLKKDLNENISDITYDTYLKKPILITLTTGATIKYIYDGNGTMIRRQHSGGTVWDYLGDMILKNGVPYEIAMAEGRVMNEEGTWRNEYEYRDNVGNLRVSFTERDGKLQQTYAAGYTPFGLVIHPEANSPVPCRYTFHGHEDHGDFGLRLTSMGARCYNQTIGRFLGYDTKSMEAPSWTGYRLGWNQPQNVSDPTGNLEVSDGYGTVSSAAAVEYSGPIGIEEGNPSDWYRDANGKVVYDSRVKSQADLKKYGLKGDYLAETVIDFDGSTNESLDANGKLSGPGANPATVTVYGAKGSNDIQTYDGLTVSSDPNKYPMIADGEYDAGYQNMNSSPYGNNATTKARGIAPALTYQVSQNGSTNLIPSRGLNRNVASPNFGKPIMDAIFIHRTNWNGVAKSASQGCLLICGTQYRRFEKQVGKAQNIKVIVRR